MQWTWAVLRHELFQWIDMRLSDQLLPLVANYDINNLISFINVSYDWSRRNDRDWYVDSIFLSFRYYLPSGLSMRKQRFDPIHFDKRASWNSILQRTGNQWNDTTVNISKTVRDREKMSIGVFNCLHGSYVHELSEWWIANHWPADWLLKVLEGHRSNPPPSR